MSVQWEYPDLPPNFFLSNQALVLDGTDLPIAAPTGNFSLNRAFYSHKHRNLAVRYALFGLSFVVTTAFLRAVLYFLW